MPEPTPHVEKCPTCGHVRVNLTGPPPGPTRPQPSDLERTSLAVFDLTAGPLLDKFVGATITAEFDATGKLVHSGTSMQMHYSDSADG